MNRWLKILMRCGVLAGSSLWAQNSPTLDFEFSVMGSDRMRDIGYAQLKPEARVNPRPTAADFAILPLRVSLQGRSDLYTYSGPLPLRFVATSGTGDELRATRHGLGRSLSLTPEEDGSVAVMWIDDSAATFPAGHVRMVNLAGQKIKGTLDGTPFRMELGQPVREPQVVDDNIRLGVAYERFDRPVVVFDQSLRLSSRERILLVFLPPFREGADVRARVVRDQVREPAIP